MRNAVVINPSLFYHVNVVVSADALTVRLLRGVAEDVALNPALQVPDDQVRDYLNSHGTPWEVDHEFQKRWFNSGNDRLAENDAVTIERSTTLGSGNLADGTIWTFLSDMNGRLRVVNQSIMTKEGRTPLKFALMQERAWPILSFYPPIPNENWDAGRCVFMTGGADHVLWQNHGAIEHSLYLADYLADPATVEQLMPLPSLQVRCPGTIKQDELAEAEVTAIGLDGQRIDADIYIEPMSGYVSKRKLAGSTKFYIYPLGLKVGEELRFKAGFRHRPGLVEGIATVVA